jgi:hypothetical protein
MNGILPSADNIHGWREDSRLGFSRNGSDVQRALKYEDLG